MNAIGRAVPKRDLKPLTSLRFAAAMLVYCYHALGSERTLPGYNLGAIGVGFFFVLSGFILTYAHHADFAAGFSAAATRRFLVARFARIYPTHAVTMLAAGIGLAIAGNYLPWNLGLRYRVEESLTQALLVHAWSPDVFIRVGLNSPSWSISDEAFFYACFPVLAVLGSHWVAPQARSRILLYGLLLWAAGLALAASGDWSWWKLYTLPTTRLIDFAVGMLAGYAFLRPSRAVSAAAATRNEIAALLAFALAMLALPSVPWPLRPALWMMPWAAFAILTFAEGRGAISRFLSHPACVRLGEISFAFYLVHHTVLLIVQRFAGDGAFTVLAAFALSLAASLALFLWVETPARHWIRSVAESPAPRAQRAGVRRPTTTPLAQEDGPPLRTGKFW